MDFIYLYTHIQIYIFVQTYVSCPLTKTGNSPVLVTSASLMSPHSLSRDRQQPQALSLDVPSNMVGHLGLVTPALHPTEDADNKPVAALPMNRRQSNSISPCLYLIGEGDL